MDQILGHANAIALFQAALDGGRLHHAWIFQGPGGVGKFTTACALGKLLLCHDPQTNLTGQQTACDVCESCRLFDASPPSPADQKPDQPAKTSSASQTSEGSGGSSDKTSGTGGAHPDFHVVAKELARYSDDAATRRRKLMNIPVEVLREYLIEPVYRAAQLGHRKVFVVDEAELVDPIGQNILLKTLEEPPAGTHIILVTSKPDRLLSTVQSRCQRLVFGPVPEELMAQWLHEHMSDLNDADRDWVMSFADGSPGRMLMARQYNLFAWYRHVLPTVDQAVQGRLNPQLGSDMAKFIDDLANDWVSNAWNDRRINASKEAANKMASELMFIMLAQHARRALAHHAQQQQGRDIGEVQDILQPWLNVIDALGQAQSELAANVALKLVMDHLASMIARPWRLPVVAGVGY